MGSVFSLPSIITGLVIILGTALYFWYQYSYKKKAALKRHEEVSDLKMLDEPVPQPKTNLVNANKKPVKTYPAFAYTPEGLKFIQIDKRVGNIHYLEPSLPHHGAHYLVYELNEQYYPWDPREQPLIHNETPKKAFRAIKWDEVKRLFAYKFGIWDKINTVLIGLFIVGGFVTLIIVFSNIFGAE